MLKLQDGSIWVHSPVGEHPEAIQSGKLQNSSTSEPNADDAGLDDRLKAALAKLGPVKHVVSPNYELRPLLAVCIRLFMRICPGKIIVFLGAGMLNMLSRCARISSLICSHFPA